MKNIERARNEIDPNPEFKDINVLILAMQRAGDRAKYLRDRGLTHKVKGESYDIATNADKPIEGMLIQEIRKHAPRAHILGEESGGAVRSDGWTLDGIDGTSYFARGFKEWAISLSQIKDGLVILGMIFCPDLNELYWAKKGEGAFLNGKKIHVSTVIKPEECIVSLGQDIIRMYGMTDIEERFKHKTSSRAHYETASSAVAYGRLAAGQIDIAVHPGQPIWDIAPGIILVNEAGGRFTNWKNKEEFKITGDRANNIIASNGLLHAQAIELLKPRK